MRLIYDEAAAKVSELKWLPQLLSNHPVLLVEDQHGQLSFAAASNSSGSNRSSFTNSSSSHGSAFFVPDAPRLAALFKGHCNLLAVAPEEVPKLQPLLDCIKPPLPPLSSSIRRSYAVSPNAESTLDSSWTARLTMALPLVARVLYKDHFTRYNQLLESGELEQFMGMQVYDYPGLEEVLTLGDVTLKQRAFAVAETRELHQDSGTSSRSCTRLLLDSSCKSSTLLRYVADTYADLLLGDGLSTVDGGKFRQTVKSLLTALGAEDGNEEAEEELQHLQVGEIPRELRLWLVAGEGGGSSVVGGNLRQLRGSSRALWEGDSEEEEEDQFIVNSSYHQMVTTAAPYAEKAGK